MISTEDDLKISEEALKKTSSSEIEVAEQPIMQKPCYFTDPGVNVSIFNGYELLTNFSEPFVHDTILTARCLDIGRFQLIGPKEFVCQNGQWSNDQMPVCDGLSQEYNYDREYLFII